jgi:hypothetical protein
MSLIALTLLLVKLGVVSACQITLVATNLTRNFLEDLKSKLLRFKMIPWSILGTERELNSPANLGYDLAFILTD